ncbi:MAG: Glu-tRNA(Gln) amidotransferase subunit GatE [Candidatus Heimdallarchaeota archaeon]|nr:MAG: Glu-tRNA(Gln) amidotransferase subunit GatE [Candidatus Heimdallarchaeota archaeon]
MTGKIHDYKALGFKAGIEIHAQLSTKRKLFCHCPAVLSQDDPQSFVQRKFRPVLGEMGIFDPALLVEFEKGHTIFYEVFDSVCTYELDETPPFKINEDALYASVKLAKMLNCHIVEETSICRKNYLDGSVPCGFQRTALVGYDGYISLKKEQTELEEKKLVISWIYIEEDAARKDNDRSKDKNIFFKLDRLGIPLIEIVTDHNLYSPTEVVSAARTLGMLIKSSGIVRKGLGTLRQDINVSIAKGDRVELKGIQLLDLIPNAIDLEIQRQKGLISIQEELSKRNIQPKDILLQILDATEIFSNSSSKMVQSAFKREQRVFLLPIAGFNGLLGRKLQPNKRFGTELSDRVKAFTNLKGIIHSDEDLMKYNFSEKEIQKLSRYIREEDAYVIVIGKKEEAEKALTCVHERIIAAIQGVHPETRQVDSEGISTFTRDLHGRSRLYPDTDLPPLVIDPKRVKIIQESLPEHFWDRIDKISKKYSITESVAEDLVYKDRADVFEKLMQKKAPLKTVITTLTQTLTAISREGVNIDEITDDHLMEIFRELRSKRVAKEAIPEIIIQLGTDSRRSVKEIVSKFGGGMSEEELNQLIVKILNKSRSLIKERGMDAFSPLMGLVMKDARGKIDGKIVSDTLRKLLKERV